MSNDEGRTDRKIEEPLCGGVVRRWSRGDERRERGDAGPECKGEDEEGMVVVEADRKTTGSGRKEKNSRM